MRHQRLVELLPLLTTSLEKNASREVYRKTKVAMNELIMKVSDIVKRALPALDSDGCGHYPGQSNAYRRFVAGIPPQSGPGSGA
jgi:hypothetical protein